MMVVVGTCLRSKGLSTMGLGTQGRWDFGRVYRMDPSQIRELPLNEGLRRS